MRSWIRLFVVAAVIAVLAISSSAQKRQASAAGGFTLFSLAGMYAFHFQGIHSAVVTVPNGAYVPPGSPNCPSPPNVVACLVAVTFPIAAPQGVTGLFMADGAGHIVAGSGSFSSYDLVGNAFSTVYTATNVSCQFTVTGTYLVNPDGTGSMTLAPAGTCVTPGLTATFNFILADVVNGAASFGVVSMIPIPDFTPGNFPSLLGGTFGRQ